MDSQNNHEDVQYLEKHLKENPESMLFARLADRYLEEKRVKDAIELCEEGIKKHPYYATGHFVLGKGYLAQKMYEQAEKEFKRVLLFDPKFLAAHKYYGDLMREIGWENTCETSYKKILKIDPLDEVARSMVNDSPIEEQAPPQAEPADAAEAEKPVMPEIDLNAISPLPVTEEEEELMFKEPEQDESKAKAADVEAEPPKSEAPAVEPEAADDPKITQIDEEPELDEKKAEEFSYILDDIFKDEVVEGGSKSAVAKEADITKEQSPETSHDHDKFLAEFGLESGEISETSPDAAKAESAPPTPATETAAPDKIEEPKLAPPPVPEKTPEPAAKTPAPPEPPKLAKGKKGDKIVTPTLGEIYAAQGQYSKAIDVFETLIKKHPDNEFYAQKLEMLRAKLAEEKNAAKG